MPKNSILLLPRTLLRIFVQIIFNAQVRVAGASSLATTLLLFAYLRLKKEDQVRKLKSDLSLELSTPNHVEPRLLQSRASSLPTSEQLQRTFTTISSTDSLMDFAPKKIPPEDLIREQLSRNYLFFGEEGMQKIRNSFVIVVGVGGVGSHAAHMLARSGVKKLRLIDFDQVTLSSLNRHAVARLEDVGSSKVACLKKHLSQIAPFVEIETCVELYTKEARERLLADNPDFVLDCIDNLDTKLDLINYCYQNKIPMLASMGAGTKYDPSRIQLADISDTFEDSLARTVRRRLRKEYGIENGVLVVYSTEKPHAVKLAPLDEEKVDKADEFATLPDFRARILPVLGTIPAIFGQVMASYTLTTLADFPMEPIPIKVLPAAIQRMYAELCTRDAMVYGNRPPCDHLLEADVRFLVEEIFRSSSVVSGSNDKPTLVRWIKSQPTTMENLVLMTKGEAKKHDGLGDVDMEAHYGKEIVELVQRRFQEIRDCNVWRLQ